MLSQIQTNNKKHVPPYISGGQGINNHHRKLSATMHDPHQSYKHPLTSSLDEFIKQYSNITKHEATYVEAKEFRSVSGTEFETNLGFIRMPQTRIFDLSGYLIYELLALRWDCSDRCDLPSV